MEELRPSNAFEQAAATQRAGSHRDRDIVSGRPT